MKNNIKKIVNKEQIIDIFNLIKKKSNRKFIESIDISINLSFNKNIIDKCIYGSVLLPYRINNNIKILVFTNNNNYEIANISGATYVGNKDLIKIIKDNKIKYDIVLSTPDVLNIVSKVGYILGPKGLMPNLKLGTITNDLKKTIFEFKNGKIIYKSDKFGIINCSIGKINFSSENLYNNTLYFIYSVINIKNSNKNNFLINKITVSSTMGKSYIINLNK